MQKKDGIDPKTHLSFDEDKINKIALTMTTKGLPPLENSISDVPTIRVVQLRQEK